MNRGLYPRIPMRDYLALDAIGSSRLEWLAVSPLHYRYMLTQPPEDTEATRRGVALHMALLEPDVFRRTYSLEPDPEVIAPENAKPRATKAYKDAVAALEGAGLTVLKADEYARVIGMSCSIERHPQAMKLLTRAPQREVTGLWDLNERLCRGRFDLLGDGILADVKTTRSLRDFSPWTITKRGYYRQLAHYVRGLEIIGNPVENVFIVAVESSPPFDVGVFVLDEGMLDVGRVEIDYLLRKLDACELSGDWPGQFPDLQQAMLTDAAAIQFAGEEDAA
jgi:exodeoxyribonuclease VIII